MGSWELFEFKYKEEFFQFFKRGPEKMSYVGGVVDW